MVHHAQAATVTCNWTDNSGASDNNWNTATNWSCGNVPNNTDNVILNSTANYPLTINATATAASFTSNSGYTQTITANFNLTLDTSQGGTGTFTLASSSYNANATTLTIPGGWNTSVSTFVAASSTVNFTASTTGQTIQPNSNPFNVLTFNGTSPGAWTLQGNLTAASLTLTSGKLIDGGNQVTVNGNISIANTAGLLTSTGSWIQGASGSISNPYTNNCFKNLTIAGSGVTTMMAGSVYVGWGGSPGGTLTMGSGTLNGANQILYFYPGSNNALIIGNLTMGSALGAFYYVLTSNITQNAITLPNGFGGVIINLNGGTPSNLTATGNFNFGTNSLTIQNSGVTGTPTNYLNMAASTLTCGTLTIGVSTTNSYLKLGNSALHSVGSITHSGTATSSILDMGSSTITSSGNVTFTDINVVQGSSTLVLAGTSASGQITPAGNTLYNLTQNGAGGTYTLESALNVANNLNIATGTLDASASNCSSASCNITVGGSWSNTGTFTPRTGTVTLNGSGQSISGNTTFYNLTKSVSATDTLTFAASSTQTIANTIVLNGASGNLLSLLSSASGTQWNINPQGTRTLSYLYVKDSDNTNATPIAVSGLNITSGGNNSGWSFPATSYTFTGPTAGEVNVTSTNFTITPNGLYTGTIIPSSTGAGTFSPTSLTWSSSTAAQTFTYAPTSVSGSPQTISVTSSPGLTNPSSISYTVTSPVTYYWYGGTGNWSDYANHWSTNSGNSPSSPAPSAPQSGDSVVFDANSGTGTATIDPGSVTVASFNASAASVAINDGGHTITVNGNILISSTTSRLTSSGSWIQGASGNISNPTSGNFFKNLTIAGSGVTTAMVGNVYVGYSSGGTLTLGSGTLNGAGQILYVYAASNDALTVNNLTTGSVLSNLYFVLLNTITQKAITLPNNFTGVIVNLNGTLHYNLTATGNFNFGNNSLTIQNSGVTSTPTNYLNMATSTLTCGTLALGVTTGNGYLKLGSSALASVGSITHGGTATSSILDMGSSTITSSGNVNFTSINVVQGSSTLVMTATSSLTSAGQSLNNLTYNSSGTLTLNDNATIGGNLTISAGMVSPDSTTVTMNGNGNTLALNSQPLNNLTVGGNTTLGGNLTLLGNLTINSGITFNTGGSSYAVAVAGNWTDSGVYTGNNSPVALNGSGNQEITGSNTFYQLTAAASSTTRTLTFVNGTTQTISNALSLTGSGGNLLLLRSDSQGHSWNITPNGSRTVSYVDVEDSYNTVAANPIVATNSNDSGDNTNWTITPPPLTVSAQTANPIGETTATLNGTIASTGGTNPYVEGFYLYNGGTCSGSVIQNPNNSGGSYSTGPYSLSVTGLSNGTQYSYTAYATNSSQTSSSSCENFTTVGPVYYTVSGNNTWVRGSISSNEDIAQEYATFDNSGNNNFSFLNAYIITLLSG